MWAKSSCQRQVRFHIDQPPCPGDGRVVRRLLIQPDSRFTRAEGFPPRTCNLRIRAKVNCRRPRPVSVPGPHVRSPHSVDTRNALSVAVSRRDAIRDPRSGRTRGRIGNPHRVSRKTSYPQIRAKATYGSRLSGSVCGSRGSEAAVFTRPQRPAQAPAPRSLASTLRVCRARADPRHGHSEQFGAFGLIERRDVHGREALELLAQHILVPTGHLRDPVVRQEVYAPFRPRSGNAQ